MARYVHGHHASVVHPDDSFDVTHAPDGWFTMIHTEILATVG